MNILFVCTQNIQRSPTARRVFKEMCEEAGMDVEIKTAGVSKLARTQANSSVIKWADRIYAMEDWHKKELEKKSPEATDKVKVLEIPDVYPRDHPELVSALKEKLKEEIPD